MEVMIRIGVVVVVGAVGFGLGVVVGLMWGAVRVAKLLTPNPRDGRGVDGLDYVGGPASEGDDLVWWDAREASHKVSGMKKEDY